MPNPKASTVSFSSGALGLWSPSALGVYAVPPIQSGGRLHFPLINSGAAALGDVSAIDLVGHFDFSLDRSGIVWASIATGLHTRTSWTLACANGDTPEIDVLDGALICRYYQGGDNILVTLPFDPIQHACWQLRNDGTTTFWDIGPVPTGLVTVAHTTAITAAHLADVTDATISVAITATGGAIVGESAIAGYNAVGVLPGWLAGAHDPMLDLILASVRATYSTG